MSCPANPPAPKCCRWCHQPLVKWQVNYCGKACSNLSRARERRAKLIPPPPVEGATWIPIADGRFALVDADLGQEMLRYSWSGGGSKGQYAHTPVGGKMIYLHHMVLPGCRVDHKNGNTLDCRRDNLRPSTQAQNARNMRRKSKATPYKGICSNPPGWAAQIRENGKKVHLGQFKTPEEAARAYDEAARRIHGEFACVNFPREGERGALDPVQ